jgi:hypothetical protein
LPTIPPSDPAPLRHLGAGSPGPVRSPLIYGLVALLVLVALPLYLMRRPKPIPSEPDAGRRAEVVDAGAGPEAGVATVDAGPSKKVVLGEPRSVKCVARGGGRVMAERCDHLVAIEDALARSIRDNVACAPPSATPFTVSFVLTVDFDRKKLHLWAGKSGTLKKRSSGDLIRCVEHAIPAPDFATIAHQYTKYDVNIMASYPPTGVAGSPLGGS